MIKDFIGVFDDAGSKDFCKKCIDHFNASPTISRSKHTNDSKMKQDNNIYFLQNTETWNSLLSFNQVILQEFIASISSPFQQYKEQYSILEDGLVGKYDLNPDVKIQKTAPGEGFHVWHAESSNLSTARRVILVMMYLNTCREGGETEFLYQHKRVSSLEGRVVFCPAYWTHAHRGNPPLEGSKYMINGWLEFTT